MRVGNNVKQVGVEIT